MVQRIELLAPAGDHSALRAAVENGADAVYLGGKLFNARQFAGNFEKDQLKVACEYAHIRGVRIYLAMNTLLLDKEMSQAIEGVGQAYMAGIDGVIVQDVGLAGIIKRLFPDLHLHGSTQMTVHTLEGARLLEKEGFQRVVLARELSLEEITHISRNSGIETEVFVHGALCIGYSGQCLMSSMIGGRSGNRGKCAQPCRLPYTLQKKGQEQVKKDMEGYILSPKDICTVSELQGLWASGATSLKIEGRMKSAEYVAIVTSTYRKYLDALQEASRGAIKIAPEDASRLAQIFNRGGFSKGYLYGKSGKAMMCYDKPKNKGLYLGQVIAYDKMARTIKIKLEEALSLGDGIEVWNGEEESPGTIVSGMAIEVEKTLPKGRETEPKGKALTQAKPQAIVWLSHIKGKINPGDPVYKTSSKQLNIEARESFEASCTRKIKLNAFVHLEEEKPAMLRIDDGEGHFVEVDSTDMPSKALNRPLTEDVLRTQIEKTGNTPFSFESIQFCLSENLSMPLSHLNAMRRDALAQMEALRAIKYKRKLPFEGNIEEKIELYLKECKADFAEIADVMENNVGEFSDTSTYFPGNGRHSVVKPAKRKTALSVFLHRIDRLHDMESLDADRLYVPLLWALEEQNAPALQRCSAMGKEIFGWVPPILRGNVMKQLQSKQRHLQSGIIEGVLLGNLGAVEYFRAFSKLRLAGDYNLNVFNAFSVSEMARLGLESVTLSPELNLKQAQDIVKHTSIGNEWMIYGRLPLMISEYCVVGSVAGGFNEKTACKGACAEGEYVLKDRKGILFPVLCDRLDCRSVILNSSVLFVADSMDHKEAQGVDSVRMDITDEKPEEIHKLVALHRAWLEEGSAGLKRYGDVVAEIKNKGFTRGHYFRGV